MSKYKYYNTKVEPVREYRVWKAKGIVQCKNQTGEWFESQHTLKSFTKMMDLGFLLLKGKEC